MLQRVKEVQESDLRMDGALARNIQRVIAVTQADIDAAAAQGKAWVVKPVVKVSDPLDNLRGGTQLVIKQNSILPGQNVMRVMYVGGQAVVVGPGTSPLSLPDATDNDILSLIALGGTEQRNLPDNYIERQFIYMMDGSYIRVEDLPISAGYRVEFDFQTLTLSSPLRNYLGGRAGGVSAGGGFRLSKLASSNNNRVVLYGFESGTEYYDPTTQFQANTRYKYTYDNGVCTLESGGSVVSTRTFTVTDNTSTNWGINTYGNGTYWQTDSDGIYVYSLKVWNTQGELVMDLVPAVQRGTVPVVGFYDVATGGFRTATAGTFAAGGEAVPTPDTPMDIVSNNGALKARHQSGLPLGYTLLEYIDTDGNSWIDTGITPTATTLQFDYKMQILQQDYVSLFGAVAATTPRYGFRVYYQPISSTNTLNWQSGSFGGQQVITWNDVLQGIVIATQGVSVVSTINGTTQTYNSSAIDLTQSDTMFLGTTHLGTTSGRAPTRIWSFKITKDGTVVRDFVPAKNASNVIGMYDLVSGQFFTNAGTGDFVAGSTVSDPVEVYTTGPIETITIKDDQSATVSTATCEDLLSVGTYTDEQEVISGVVTRKVGVKVLDGTENWQNLSGYFNLSKTDLGSNSTVMPSNSHNIICSHFETKDGTFTDGIGIGGSYVNFKYDSITTVLADWKTWLAAQYAAGTPVIVVFPLETPTTETVTGQPMETAAGDNTAEITQAGMAGLELEVEYVEA